MKKIFTLIFACIAAISAMADDVQTFTGHSEFYLPDMKEATLTTKVKDAVVLETNSDGSHFTIPDMTYNFMGTDMTIKSFVIHVESMEDFGKTDDGDVFITWNEDNFTTTTTGVDGLEKAVTGTNFKAKLLGGKRELTVEFTFKYGTMPYGITYSLDGFYTADNAWGLVGEGTAACPYRIFDAADFTAMATNYNAESNTGNGKYFLMMNDVDFGGTAENPVQLPAIGKNAELSIGSVTGGFDGTFDGGNYYISGIYHTNNGQDADGKYNALFSLTDVNAVIKNIRISENNHICGYNYVGGIVSINQGTISECINNADITAANFAAGGICGHMVNGNGTINDCHNAGNITAMTYAAGICGSSQSGKSITAYNYYIYKCSNYGKTVTTNGVGAAGIAGSYSGKITNCDNYGDVDDSKGTGKTIQYTAGIVSCPSYAISIEYCKNEGNISGGKSVGGIVGNVMKGEDDDVAIYNCTNNGAVSGTGDNVAGIVGNSARTDGKVTVEKCTNNGVVTSTGTTELLGNIRGSEKITVGDGNTISESLEKLPLDTDNIVTGIEDVTAKENANIADGKYLKNGKLVIVKNGKTYNALGIEL